jgi:hypothetical protein
MILPVEFPATIGFIPGRDVEEAVEAARGVSWIGRRSAVYGLVRLGHVAYGHGASAVGEVSPPGNDDQQASISPLSWHKSIPPSSRLKRRSHHQAGISRGAGGTIGHVNPTDAPLQQGSRAQSLASTATRRRSRGVRNCVCHLSPPGAKMRTKPVSLVMCLRSSSQASQMAIPNSFEPRCGHV